MLRGSRSERRVPVKCGGRREKGGGVGDKELDKERLEEEEREVSEGE